MGRLYQWIDRIWQGISKTVFVRFEFLLPPDELRQRALREGRLVFALTHGGIIEWLILSSWCRTQGLGAILVANRKRILLLSKPKYFFQAVFRQRSFADLFARADDGGPRLLFVSGRERRELFVSTPSEEVLAGLYSQVGAAPNGLPAWTLVPVYMLWRRHVPGETRKLSEYLLGLSSNPNLFGKLWYLLRRRTDSTVRCLGVFSLLSRENEEVLETWAESDAIRFARSTRRKVIVLVNRERRILLGPRYHSPTYVKESLMRDPDVQKLLQEIAERDGVDKRREMAKAYRILTEIVANYKFRCVEVIYVLLDWLFSKVFDGISYRDEDSQRVREAMKTRPVIFIPCHRSHLDYLVIPYLFFANDIVTPHIAAGINLAFWPVGPFLRMAGAFFIRRSFRGDLLYSALLRKYIEYLLKNRFNIKFFIEGTRSRSGKMLSPAYGLLKMVIEAHRHRAVEDIALVPVAICYDEVPEQGSYSKELGGGEKERESAGALIRARKMMRRRFGKVYVRMSDTISLKELAYAASESGIDHTLMLQKTAFQICKAINDATPITAKSLVSTIFLTHHSTSLSFEETRRLTRYLAGYASQMGFELSVPGEKALDRSVEKTMRRLHRSGVLVDAGGIPRGYTCEGKKRVVTNFYKNNSIHCFVRPAVMILSFLHVLRKGRDSQPSDFYQNFVQSVTRLRNMLKFEFFFSPTGTFLEEIDRDCEFFFGVGRWRDRPAGEWLAGLRQSTNTWNDLSIYSSLLGDLLESYTTVAAFFMDSTDAVWDRKALIQKMVKFGEFCNQQGKLSYPESISVQNYSNALSFFENQKILQFEKLADRTSVVKVGGNAGLKTFTGQAAEFLELMRIKPETLVFPQADLNF